MYIEKTTIVPIIAYAFNFYLYISYFNYILYFSKFYAEFVNYFDYSSISLNSFSVSINFSILYFDISIPSSIFLFIYYMSFYYLYIFLLYSFYTFSNSFSNEYLYLSLSYSISFM